MVVHTLNIGTPVGEFNEGMSDVRSNMPRLREILSASGISFLECILNSMCRVHLLHVLISNWF